MRSNQTTARTKIDCLIHLPSGHAEVQALPPFAQLPIPLTLLTFSGDMQVHAALYAWIHFRQFALTGRRSLLVATQQLIGVSPPASIHRNGTLWGCEPAIDKRVRATVTAMNGLSYSIERPAGSYLSALGGSFCQHQLCSTVSGQGHSHELA